MHLRTAALALALALVLDLLVATTLSAQSYRVDPRPRLTVGEDPGDPKQQFVRILDVVALPGGRVAILDAGVPAVRVFDATGTWVMDVGRTGNGPGEFRDPVDLAFDGTGLGILDRDGRFEWFTDDGRPRRSDRAPLGSVRNERFNTAPARLLATGAALLEAPERMFGRARGEYRQQIGLLIARGGRITDTVGWFAHDSGRADAQGVPVPRPYLPPTGLLHASGGGRIATMTADRPRITLFSTTGRRLGAFEVALRAGPVRDADIARLVTNQVRPTTGNDRRVVTEWETGRPRAQAAPLAARLLLPEARPGEIWIERFGRPDGRATWLVVSDAGATRGEVRLPVGFELFDVGRDFVLGLSRDADDIETVVRHPLAEPAPTR
jgi:hypothetical protein